MPKIMKIPSAVLSNLGHGLPNQLTNYFLTHSSTEVENCIVLADLSQRPDMTDMTDMTDKKHMSKPSMKKIL